MGIPKWALKVRNSYRKEYAMNHASSAIENYVSPRQWWLFFTLGSLPVIGILVTLIISFNFTAYYEKTLAKQMLPVFVTVGYCILIGGAAYVTGGFGGFLFGLPRYLTNPDRANKDYSRNDNLIQISDWLTKIIVGLGLTNLHKVPAMLADMGEAMKVVFMGNPSSGSVIAQAIVVYFLVCGFMFGYLWTNIQYIPILSEADRLAKNITAENEAKARAANEAIDAHTNSINSTDPAALQKIQDQRKNTPQKPLSVADFNGLIDIARQKMERGIVAQSNLPREQQDPNKGQWGSLAENKERRITGTINPVDGSGLYRIKLMVTSTNIANPLNEGDIVLFSLHPTFVDPYKIVVVKDGIAALEFIAYGVFTVGVLISNANIELEYNLATLPDAPEKFLRR